jgi:predicted site-specific integrase-resolvase
MTAWLTTKQLARDLKVSEHSLRHWLRQGLVPGAVKLPSGEYRLPPDTEKYLLRPPEPRASRGAA